MYMRLIKRIGIVALILSMMYASNWDLPQETREDWLREHETEIEEYERLIQEKECVVIDGEVYTGEYINGVWYEALEIYGGSIPEEYMEKSDVDI